MYLRNLTAKQDWLQRKIGIQSWVESKRRLNKIQLSKLYWDYDVENMMVVVFVIRWMKGMMMMTWIVDRSEGLVTPV